MNNLRIMRLAAVAVAVLAASVTASAQKYQNGLIDKTVAVVGNEIIMLSDVEEEIKNQQMGGYMSDKSGRCEMLETMMVSKLFLMQARVDSINVNLDMVESELRNRIDNVRTQLGGDEEVDKYFFLCFFHLSMINIYTNVLLLREPIVRIFKLIKWIIWLLHYLRLVGDLFSS